MSKSLNIAVITKKGGAGKSAISILLYEALRHVGKVVALRDWDPQGTSTKALGYINPEYQSPALPEIIIWDTPPNLQHTATATAARSADIAVVVTSPSPSDGWEAQESVEFVTSKNPNAIVRVVCNKYKKSTILGRLVDPASQDVGAPMLPVMLNYRECYMHVVAQGWKALDVAAREEVLQFAVALLSIK